jgi:hypothetical protein
MDNKTESYIVLKPIAERFSKIANEMTDDEIKSLIKSELREQIKLCDFGKLVGYIVDEYFEDETNIEKINNVIEESIKNKFR